MKKNYVKPSLLSETFVTENIMTGTDLSAVSLWTLTGTQFEGIQFNRNEGGNTLYKVNFSDFNK
ncbi:MAG: hypothetical protein IJ304_06360 [Clostridia bacterium]|nr:hypothetical protein [Clostridia bacterium]